MRFSSKTFARLLTGSMAIMAVAASTAFAPVRVIAQAPAAAPAPAGQAAGDKPMLVASIAGTSELTSDVMYITGLVGQPNSGNMFAMMAGMFTQGIDPTQPTRIVVEMVNGAPEPIIYVPTADVKVILKRLEAQTGPIDELPDGTMAFLINNNTVYVAQRDGVAVLARSREVLAAAPQDTSAAFEGIGNEYLIALRASVQDIPEPMRQGLIGQLRSGFERGMENADETDPEAIKQAEASIAQIEKLMNEADEVFFGINVDSSAGEIVIDTSFKGVPGSDMAKMYNAIKPIPSSFATVVREDAAGYYHSSITVSPEMAKQTRASIESSMGAVEKMIKDADEINEEQADELISVINRVLDLSIDSMAEGKQNIGAVLMANGEKMQFVLGSFVADGNEAAQILRDVAEKVEGLGDAPTFAFDRGKYKDVMMHLVSAEVPAGEDEARKMFGDELKLHIGTSEKAVYVALGDQSVDLLKEMIDNAHSDSNASRPAAQLKVNMLPILYYIQSIEDSVPVSAMISALTSGEGPGAVNMIANGIPNGQASRISISADVLRAVGGAVTAAQQERMNNEF